MLALLNDAAILSIAYDNVRYSHQPESWHMRLVLGISTVLGVLAVVSTFGTQILATFIAVYGLFMTPLGWGWALFVWGYALAWFLVNDRLKLLAYRLLDPPGSGAHDPTAVTSRSAG